jgi:hypothetical protein
MCHGTKHIVSPPGLVGDTFTIVYGLLELRGAPGPPGARHWINTVACLHDRTGTDLWSAGFRF